MSYAMFIYFLLLHDDSCEIYRYTYVHSIKLAPTTLLSPGLIFVLNADIHRGPDASRPTMQGSSSYDDFMF